MQNLINMPVHDRYNLDNLRHAVQNPSAFRREILRSVSKIYFQSKHGSGIDVVAEDWDNLIILDACRYDYFSEQCSIQGNLRPVASKGPHSWAFLKDNFVGRELHDTVYVTANVHVQRLNEDIFYTVEPLLDHWDEDVGTVLPGDVVEAAIDANKAYPDKRLIVHFMQPHIPFLGATAEEVRSRVDLYNDNRDQEGIKWYKAVQDGRISIGETISAYRESLDIVLDSADKLINNLDGKSVITADHGELLGEQILPFTRPLYGHPGVYTPKLCTVPWLEVPGETRRNIVAEDPIGFQRLEEDSVSERLVALGYKNEL